MTGWPPLMSQTFASLLSYGTTKAIGCHALKGFADPMALYTVVDCYHADTCPAPREPR